MDDLTAFLRARLGEREARAKAAGGASWSVGTEETPDGENAYYSVSAYGESEWFIDAGATEHELAKLQHIAANDPEFVLADVAAKRRIVEQYELAGGGLTGEILRNCLDTPIRLLALPFAGHAEFREEWRPGVQTAQPDRPGPPPRRSVFDTSDVEAYWHSRNNLEG